MLANAHLRTPFFLNQEGTKPGYRKKENFPSPIFII